MGLRSGDFILGFHRNAILPGQSKRWNRKAQEKLCQPFFVLPQKLGFNASLLRSLHRDARWVEDSSFPGEFYLALVIRNGFGLIAGQAATEICRFARQELVGSGQDWPVLELMKRHALHGK